MALSLPPSSTLARSGVAVAALVLSASASWAADCGERLDLDAEFFVSRLTGSVISMAAGDWNEDGRPDMATLQSDAKLTVLFGEGGFRMIARHEIALDNTPRWLVAADMDRDGHQDLIVAGVGGTRILAGDGTGAFREADRFPEPSLRAAAGDLDGDGTPDLVLATTDGQMTLRFLGNGEVHTIPSAGADPHDAVLLADFDRDGDLDVAAAPSHVWLNDGQGNLGGPGVQYTGTCDIFHLAAGDLNGDGETDLYGLGSDGSGCNVALLGMGDGTFRRGNFAGVAADASPPGPPRAARRLDLPGDGAPGGESDPARTARHIPPPAHFVLLGDFNGDGRDEPIHIRRERGEEVRGQRSIPPNVACAADVNQDGKQDVIVGGYEGIAIHPGLGNGRFRYTAIAETGFPPGSTKLVDLDGDGRRDVTMNDEYGDLVVVLTAPDGGVGRVVRNPVFPSSWSVEFADFNNDGHPDLLDQYDGIYFGNGDGSFQKPPIPGAPSGFPGDFNEDGFVDVASPQGTLVRIEFGNGDGTFREGMDLPVAAWRFEVCDVDHDGHLDLVATDKGSVIFGRGDGTASAYVDIPAARWIATLGDFDGDGRIDMIVATSSEFVVYLCRGRTFERAAPSSLPTTSAGVGDLDGDGHVDLMAYGAWFGRGDGTFEASDTRFGPAGLTLLDDRNGDGLSDVVVSGNYDVDGYLNTVSVLMNMTARNDAPDVSAARAEAARTWPPNGDLVDVAIDGVSDPDGDPVTITITSVTQDEPQSGGRGAAGQRGSRKSGSDCADATIDAAGVARVRLERNGSGNGRVYEIEFTATDDCGGSSTGRVSVCVPHDPGKPCVDDGQRFQSLVCDAAKLAETGSALDETPLTLRRSPAGLLNIRYALETPAEVKLEAFDVAGRRIASIASGHREPGAYETAWVPPARGGVCFIRLTRGSERIVRSFVLLQ